MAVELGDPVLRERVTRGLKEAGIMTDWFLFCDTAFRIAPPLVITEEQVRDSSRIVLEVLDKVRSESR